MMRPIILAISFFCLFSLISLDAGHCQAIHNEIDGSYYQEQFSLHSIMQKYITSIIPGIVVGGNAGLICAIADRMLPFAWPVSWIGSYIFRLTMIKEMQKDYQKRHIVHDKILMECSAFASTWVMYYKIYETLHGVPPF